MFAIKLSRTYGKGFGIEVISQSPCAISWGQSLQIRGCYTCYTNRWCGDPHRGNGASIDPCNCCRIVVIRWCVGCVRCRDIARSVVARWQIGWTVVWRWCWVSVRSSLRGRDNTRCRAHNTHGRRRVYDTWHNSGGGGNNPNRRWNHTCSTDDASGHRVGRVDRITRFVYLLCIRYFGQSA